MSENTYIASIWAGRLIDQKGKRSWEPSEAYTGLAKLSATLACPTAQADALRPAMSTPHPEFPLMLCDGRSIEEETTNSGWTLFKADFYGMRLASDEARIFHPRPQLVLDDDQVLQISIRHLHLGRPLNVKWIALLAAPRPQQMGPEFASLPYPNVLATQAMAIFAPKVFALKSRNVAEYGPYCVMDDVWGEASFYTDEPAFVTLAGGGGNRNIAVDTVNRVSSSLTLIPYSGANQSNSFEMQLCNQGYWAGFMNLSTISTALGDGQLAAIRARALAKHRIGISPVQVVAS